MTIETNKAPQFPIEGLVSKMFYIDVMPYIKTQDEEMLFVESILSALVHNFGDAFCMRITSGFREHNIKVPTIFNITFPSFQWLSDIGKKTAAFEKEVEQLLKIEKLSIRFEESWASSVPTQTARKYELVVKDGIYETKKTIKETCIIKTIEDDSVFKGSQVPVYSVEEKDF
jgi:hypothetical protein